MKDQLSQRSILRLLSVFLFASLLLSSLSGMGASSALAQAQTVELVPGTVSVSPEMQDAVVAALSNATDLFPNSPYLTMTDLRLENDWALVSILGLAQVHDGLAWSIDDGSWTGLVLLRQSQDGSWQGATQGTAEFSSLILETPDTFLDPSGKRNLDPSQAIEFQTPSSYVFPWEPGTSSFYGSYGVHDNGFDFDAPGWMAVDWLSDGNTGLGHAPNRLLASAGGTISYKCTDSNNVAVHLGAFFYTHLTDNSGLYVGANFDQGAELGQMKVGTFGSAGSGCGWTNQPAGWFHVHWGFPDADLQVEGWMLSMATQQWTNGSTTIGPGQGWIQAGGNALQGQTADMIVPVFGPPDGFTDGQVSQEAPVETLTDAPAPQALSPESSADGAQPLSDETTETTSTSMASPDLTTDVEPSARAVTVGQRDDYPRMISRPR